MLIPPSFVFALTVLLTGLTFLPGARVHAIDPVVRRGKYLYLPNNTRFYIKGIAYQESAPLAEATDENAANGGFPEPDSFIDPLSAENAANCTRDVANLRDLGVNTVRVYSVNASLNHDACMKTLSDAGIYVILDVSLPSFGSINRANPTWDVSIQDSYLRTVDLFSRKYDNVLAFNIGNEVITNSANTNAAPFVKAAARDVKAYLKSIGKENILVSYASTHGPSSQSGGWRDVLANYLTCGLDESTSIDLYGLNSYAWCGNSSYEASGYAEITREFANLPIPAFLSEFGCARGVQGGAAGRTWTEVSALFSEPMTDTFSGGVAFGYFPQAPGTLNYGMATISTSATNGAGAPQIQLSPAFQALRDQYARVTPPATPPPSTTSPQYPACTSVLSSSSNFRGSENLPPTPDASLCNCAQQSAWACLANDITANNATALGELLDTACGLLSRQSRNSTGAGNNNAGRTDVCAPVTAANGTYGTYSICTPAQRVNWALSAYYEQANRSSQACNFASQASLNATLVSPGATTTTSSGDVQQAAQSCLQRFPPSVKVPALSPVALQARTNASGTTGTSGTGGSNNVGSPNTGVREKLCGSFLAVALVSAFAALVFL